MFRLNNKIAVITGGGSGIGKAIAKLFAKQGATVHILEWNTDGANETADEIKKENDKVFVQKCNVANQQEVLAIFENIGAISILVNNAGIAHIGKADNTKEEDFDNVMSVNVKGVYNCIHGAIPQLKKNNEGCIINMASVAENVAIPTQFAYSTTKGEVMAMTLSVAKDYLQENIR